MLADRELDEVEVVDALAEHVTIRPLRRGAREHEARRFVSAELAIEAVQPRLSPPVVERDPGAYRVDARLVMEVVGVEERHPEAPGDERTDGRLPGAGDAHQHDHPGQARSGPVILFRDACP